MSASVVSPCLLAANQRLRTLRKQAQHTVQPPRNGAWGQSFSAENTPIPTPSGHLTQLLTNLNQPAPKPTSTPSPPPTTKLHPDLAHAILRQELAAPARIWLLLRHIDHAGQGVLTITQIRQHLATKATPLRVCGWRQLRNLLNAGQGIFWKRDSEQIWLRSVAKVAHALGVQRLSAKPVELPIRALLTGIGDVRAHFYSTFHSARAQAQHNKPIARATLTKLSGVGRSSQRSYEQRTGISSQPNYAIGNQIQDQQATAWQQPAAFEFVDRLGKQGAVGEKYIAWQLPNSYGVAHSHTACERQRRINRKLADLLNQRATGNSKQQIETRYCSDGRTAAQTFGRTETPRYLQQPANNFWYLIEGVN